MTPGREKSGDEPATGPDAASPPPRGSGVVPLDGFTGEHDA